MGTPQQRVGVVAFANGTVRTDPAGETQYSARTQKHVFVHGKGAI